MKAYAMDLRQRIISALQDGDSKASVARRFKVSYGTVRNYQQRAEHGALEPRDNRKRALRKFTPESMEAIKAWIEEKNDLTLVQIQQRLREQLKIEVDPSSIWDRLAAMNLTWKKNDTRCRTGASGRQGAS